MLQKFPNLILGPILIHMLVEFETQPRTVSATTNGQRLESAPADLGNVGEEAWVRGGKKAHLGDGGSKEARLGI